MPITRRDAFKLTLANAALASTACTLPAAAAAAGPEVKTLDIVFEGGGIKGAAFCGALAVLEAGGYSYRHLIGTSAGAITAALVAAGYNAAEMEQILTKRDANNRHVFNSFLLPPDASIPAPSDAPPPEGQSLLDRIKAKARGSQLTAITNLPDSAQKVANEIIAKTKETSDTTKLHWNQILALLSNGAFAGDANFLAWLCDRLKDSPLLKANKASADQTRKLTLGDFDRATRAKGVQLSVVAADVTGMRTLVLNRHTAPDVPVVDAVRMSMGIPLVWPEVEWKKEWKNYRGTVEMVDKDGAGNRVVDGGVLSNFPLRYLIEPRHTKADGVLGEPAQDVPARILGLMLDEHLGIPGVDPTEEKEQLANKLKAYQSLSRVLNAMSGAGDQEAIEDSKRPEIVKLGLGSEGPVCRIPVKGYETLDFDMDQGRMNNLIKSGRKSMEDYLGRLA